MSTSYYTIDVALIYTVIMSEICEFVDTDNGVNIAFGDILIDINDSTAQKLSADEFVSVADMKQVAKSVAHEINNKDEDTQEEILAFINNNL